MNNGNSGGNFMENINSIRNFGIIAHIDAGKTTTTERLLYITGVNHSIGEVDEGTTTTDWMDEEKERGITIQSAAVNCKYKDHSLHIIDTPGHVDFTIEVQRSLRVLDGVVVVICGVAGVQTQTRTVWKQAEDFKIPKIVFVNKLDRIGANFIDVTENIREQFKINPLIINMPHYENDQLTGIIDLISMKKISYKKDGYTDTSEEIDNQYKDLALLYREELINILTGMDDELLNKVLDNNYNNDDLINSIRKLTLENKVVPVLSGASFKNIGIPDLLDSIVNYLPSPKDRGEIRLFDEKKGNWEILKPNEAYFIGYIFKLQYHKEKGNIAYIRIYSGKLKNGDTIYNTRNGKRERVLDLLRVFSNSFERIETAYAGDIVAIVGLKESLTGDTLCHDEKKIILEKIVIPEPVIFTKVEPRNSIDLEKFNHAKLFLLSEDPTIVCREDSETGQTLIGGMGELHLEIFLERLKREFNLDLKRSVPIVAHRESPLGFGEYKYNFDKKIGGNIQHCIICMKCEKNEENASNSISLNISKKDFDKEEIEHIERGINNALVSGPQGAYPVIGAKISVEKIETEKSPLTPQILEAAANICLTYMLREIGTAILEPIMRVEIETPESYTGGIIGDLQGRNGIVSDIIKKVDYDKIIAKVPLKEMFGYSTAIRNISSGKANFSMQFLEYGNV